MGLITPLESLEFPDLGALFGAARRVLPGEPGEVLVTPEARTGDEDFAFALLDAQRVVDRSFSAEWTMQAQSSRPGSSVSDAKWLTTMTGVPGAGGV